MSARKIFTDIRHFQIFVLGAFSGMPLAVLYSTLFAWLNDVNIEIKIITSFAIARVFYSLKFIWAPFIDHMRIPLLCLLGHRKSWMIFCATAISLLLYCYSYLNPNESILNVYYVTIALGVASATFDIAFDAFRIEKLEDDMQAIGAANTIFGYRMGMLISGAGAFWFADNFGWTSTFQVLSVLYIACILFVMCISEIQADREKITGFDLHSWKVMVYDPFANFFSKKYSIIILLAIIFYKLGDAMLGVVATPFYLDLGFSKTEIASVVKIFGLGATILGSYIGGYLLFAKGDLKGMIIAGIAQSITNVAFIWLHHKGHDVTALMIAIFIENIASGMGNAALVGYMSNLCNRQYSATQYALLSSASGLFSHTIVIYGGSIVQMVGWDMYFAITVILGAPGLVLIYLLDKWINKSQQINKPAN